MFKIIMKISSHRLAHDILLDSPTKNDAATISHNANISDISPPHPVIQDNKCCHDENPVCPIVPRGFLLPSFPPSPENDETLQNPFCGVQQQTKTDPCNNVNSSKINIKSSGSSSLGIYTSQTGRPKLQVLDISFSNNNSPTHSTRSNISQNSKENHVNKNLNIFASPWRVEHVSVGEEIADAYVRSCGSPICGNPRSVPSSPPKTTPQQNIAQDSGEETDEVCEEYNAEDFYIDNEEYEVDDLVVDTDEYLQIEVEEHKKIIDDALKNNTLDSSLIRSAININITESCNASLSKEISDECQQNDFKKLEQNLKDKFGPSEIEGDSSVWFQPKQEQVVRRRRLLPEIPKHRKCKYFTIILQIHF